MSKAAETDYSALSLEYIHTLTIMPTFNQTEESNQLVAGWMAWYANTQGD
jgi:hypothetical protein